MGSVNKQMATLGKIAGKAAKFTMAGMAAAGSAVAGIAAASVEVGKAFESQMSTVAAISGATGQDFAAMEAKAKEMGATTQFSATEAGQAMEYMAMAGWKSADMVDGIEGIMNLAAASGEELASTSDIVTDALTAFGMTASDSGHFADVLAAASSNANTNVSMLGESFKYVAPIAGTLGYTAEDTSIALGLMANAGIKGSQAGTSLKTALARMAGPVGKQAEAMKELGISMADSEGNTKSLMEVMQDLRSSIGSVNVDLVDAEGNARGYDDIIADLSKSTEGLSKVQQIEAAATIFGKDAMSGMLAIVNASESDFNKLTAAIGDSAGAAERMAAVRLDNLEGDITLLKSALEGLGIEIYQGMNAPLREAAQEASGYVAQMNAAFQEGGFAGLAKSIGDVASDALTQIADRAPEFIDMAATLIDGFVDGIDQNSNKMGSAMGRLIVALASAVVRLAPRLLVTGANLLLQIGRGIIQHLPELGAAAKEAIAYLMNAAKETLGEYVDFLGDDSIAPFEKFIALIPAVAAGFAAFRGISGISKKISGFIGSIKNVGKTGPQFTKVSNEMSAAAKNILGAGAGFALAAAGVWLLADAAIRITDAGPGAVAALAVMGAGIAGLMVIAAKMGPQLKASEKGFLAFGGAILMIAGGMSLMAFAAIQLAGAGPMAFASLALMEGGIIALLAIAGAMGPQLSSSAAGLLAFGGAILMAAGGMSLMAFAATQIAAAGTPAIVALGIMVGGLAGLMALAGAMGPQLTVASVGLIAFGAGIALAATGLYIMAQAAIQLAAAGAPAQIAMAVLAAGILAFGVVAGVLSPLLLAGAAALAAFGAALAIVSAAALLGSVALTVISTALPALSAYGATGALAIMQLGTAMTVFAGGAAMAGVGAGAAALGFGALAMAGAAAALAFAPLALEMTAIAAAIAIIASGASTGAAGISSLRESSSGMVASMGKLALAFAPVAAAIVPFAAAVTAGAAATLVFAAALAASGAALLLVGAGALAVGAGLQLITVTLTAFRAAAATMGTSAGMITQALLQTAVGAAPAATAFLVLSPPMVAAAAASGVLAVALTATGAVLMIIAAGAAASGATIMIMSAALTAAVTSGNLAAVAMMALTTALLSVSPPLIAGTTAILAFSAAVIAFTAGAVAAALGFGALALAGAAAALAFAPLALEMTAIAAAIAIIASGASTGAAGISSLRESSSGMVKSMGKLALAFAQVAAAIAPFAASAAAGAAAGAALSAALMATGVGLLLVKTGVSGIGTALNLAVSAITAFHASASTMGASSSMVTAALAKFAKAFAVVSAPMSAFRANAQTTFSGIRTLVIASTTATTTQFIALWRAAQSTVTAAWISYRSSFASAWNGVHSYAVDAARNTAQQIKAAFENMTITVPRPRLPHVSVSYSTQGTGDEQVKVPDFSVSYFANGAIMTAPTLFGMVGGEAGPEGIIPLDPFWNRLDSAVAAAVQQHSADSSGPLDRAMQDAAGLERIQQSAASGVDSRAKEVYSDITNHTTVNRSNDNRSSDDSIKIVYSPQITIQGNADKGDVQQAVQQSQADFAHMMEDYNWQNMRTSMA
ncbi:MAG: phage tail tape measure protein [Eubacterium sp.]|nr:phage tail tape measure protein [Eubacterium sp.]